MTAFEICDLPANSRGPKGASKGVLCIGSVDAPGLANPIVRIRVYWSADTKNSGPKRQSPFGNESTTAKEFRYPDAAPLFENVKGINISEGRKYVFGPRRYMIVPAS